ncbi:MAG: biotin/lipoyl-binding protein, partial [Brevundimonas sp.]|nr:biotin/lipoyl-binding protein [Brevundimonas sp.]
MRRLRPVPAIGAIAILALLVWFLFLRPDEARTLTGYIEGERVYLAAPVSGAVAALYVREGERVAAGGRTFLIDPRVQRAQAAGAAAAVAAAEARARDLTKGQRAEELSVFDAELAAAQASERQAEADYGRIEPLVRQGIYAPARLDQVRAARDAARAQTAAVRRRREVA